MQRLNDTEVELTEAEQLIRELYELQLDRGLGCQDALIALRGADLSEGLRSDTPMLDHVLSPDFVDWLVG